ncbi:hypothetical protein ANN_27873 [Periplaneta americana]|uniref:HAT C-terminal dimerisation domain-containing protein n=1 Tax=Periplaneta americana TaxID=6978 RepID=A0ABQ8RVH8_PERAM|nr:hypothetical protein ANN_27873 [Periplaneta americana]
MVIVASCIEPVSRTQRTGENFFKDENQDTFPELLVSDFRCLELSYLEDIFHKLNEVNVSMQDRQETILSSTNKMKGFKRKLSSWRSAVQKGDLSNFPSLLNLTGDKDLCKLKDCICINLSRLQDAIDTYSKFTKSEASVAAFWLRLREEHPNLMKKAINVFLPFSTYYLCEQVFSAMVTMKCKARNGLNKLEDDLRLHCQL